MRTMVGLHAAPEIRGENEDLAQWYGLPRFGIGGLTGSKTLDGQAALEAALTLFASAISGGQLIHDVGYMDNGTTGSLVQLMICHEMIRWVRQALRPLEITSETLALDTIAEVAAVDGDFLQTANTMDHFREDEYFTIVDRDNYENWFGAGGLSMEDRARAQVEDILSRRAGPHVSAKTEQQIRRTGQL